MKRLAVLAAVVGLWGCALTGTARAGLITVTYSGSVSDSGAGYAIGTSFSGSFSYDPTVAAISVGGNGASFPLTAFTMDIGGDMLSLQSGEFAIAKFGEFEVEGGTMQGTGPLAGQSVFLHFEGSSDPSIANLQLPSSFPTDFASTDVSYYNGNIGELGPITAFSQVAAAPEPASLTLLGLGAAGLLGYGWRRRRAAPISA